MFSAALEMRSNDLRSAHWNKIQIGLVALLSDNYPIYVYRKIPYGRFSEETINDVN
jgi:hypothetical protein